MEDEIQEAVYRIHELKRELKCCDTYEDYWAVKAELRDAQAELASLTEYKYV